MSKPKSSRVRSTHTLHESTMPSLVMRIPPITLKSTFAKLSLELTRLAPDYERLRPPSLDPFPTLGGLLERLTDPTRRREVEHRHLVCAILAVHRSTPHRLWAAILLRVFRPMLSKTYKRLLGGAKDERIAHLLTSFQEALLLVDPHRDPLRIGMYVRQATRHVVFGKLRVDLDWDGVGFGSEPDEQPDANAEARTLAVEWLRDTPEADRELLATLSEHGALLALVQRKHPTAPEPEQARVYHLLWRERRKVAAEVRMRLGGRRKLPLSP